MNDISFIQDYKPISIEFANVTENIEYKHPLICQISKILKYNAEKEFITALVSDSGGKEILGFFYGEASFLLSKIPESLLPISIMVLKGKMKQMSGDKYFLEIHHVILDNFTYINSSSIGGHEYCEVQSFLDLYFDPYDDLNIYMFWGSLLHDYLALVFSNPKIGSMGQMSSTNSTATTFYIPSNKDILSAFQEALVQNWQSIVVLGLNQTDITAEFRSNFLENEIRFMQEHLVELKKAYGTFKIFCEKFIQSPVLGLQGRVDRFVLDKSKSHFTMIETKTGRSKRSSQAIAFYQSITYTAILQDLYGWHLDKILIEFPRHLPAERCAEYVVGTSGSKTDKNSSETSDTSLIISHNLISTPEFLKIIGIRNKLWGFLQGIPPKSDSMDGAPCGRCSAKNYCDFYKALYPNLFYNHKLPKQNKIPKTNSEKLEESKSESKIKSKPESKIEKSDLSAYFQKDAKSRALLKRIITYDTWFRLLLDKEITTVKHQDWKKFVDLEIQEQKGWTIGNLKISKKDAGFVDISPNQKYIYRFSIDGEKSLPNLRLRAGDYILLSPQNVNKFQVGGISGILTHISSKNLEVETLEPLESVVDSYAQFAYRIDATRSSYMLRIQKETLDKFLRFSLSSNYPTLHRLREILFFQEFPRLSTSDIPRVSTSGEKSSYGHLDKSQQKAVDMVMRSRDLTLIQGPPGTGKTTLIVEIIKEYIKLLQSDCESKNKIQNGKKSNSGKHSRPQQRSTSLDRYLASSKNYLPPKLPILVCAFTNKAVDNIVIKLIEKHPKIKCLRLGNPHASKFDMVRKRNLEFLCQTEKRLANGKIIVGVDPLKARILLESADVIATTTTMAAGRLLSQFHFHLVIIDEAGQVVEPAALSALVKGDRFLLVGDHQQLPPINQSNAQESASLISEFNSTDLYKQFGFSLERGLEKTLFERLVEKYNQTQNFVLLTFQYRMNERISTFISNSFYEGKLIPGNIKGKDVGSQTLHEFYDAYHINYGNDRPIRTWDQVWDPEYPMVFIDTQFLEAPDSSADKKGRIIDSKYNFTEVGLIGTVIQEFIDLLTNSELPEANFDEILAQIGIISGFRAQNTQIGENIRKILKSCSKVKNGSNSSEFSGYDSLESSFPLIIDTVDRFQGGEREIILYSMVDSNSKAILSPLNEDPRRLNVAISRAKKKIIFVGHGPTLTTVNAYDSPSTLRAKKIYQDLITYIRKLGGYISVSPQKFETLNKIN
ncbi:MAG: AAA domain-containing protein [Promethearchaeota archaeon]